MPVSNVRKEKLIALNEDFILTEKTKKLLHFSFEENDRRQSKGASISVLDNKHCRIVFEKYLNMQIIKIDVRISTEASEKEPCVQRRHNSMFVMI